MPTFAKFLVKGRKSNDAARDKALFDWCIQYQQTSGKPPTRRETAKKALELTNDANFKASKGWLDKFSRRYAIDFTPLKVFNKKVSNNLKEKLSPSISTNDSPREDRMLLNESLCAPSGSVMNILQQHNRLSFISFGINYNHQNSLRANMIANGNSFEQAVQNYGTLTIPFLNQKLQ